MAVVGMSNIDEITMRLVHYFVTKEDYQPIVVNGVENEIWLENTDAHYEVIRISSNYIHNNEQFDFDIFKTKTIVKQIKKKMLSFNCNTLNIMLNVGDNVSNMDTKSKHIDVINLDNTKTLDASDELMDLFPELKNDEIDSYDDMDFFINVTQDINETTEKKNKIFERTFSKKTIIVTYALIVINILIFMLELSGIIDIDNLAMSKSNLVSGKWWVLITALFLHGNFIHLFCNMYSLYVIGKELETVLGKIKFLIVYFISGIVGCLVSGAVSNYTSIGASGAIFGLLGALLYFGYHYRLYLGNVIMGQIVPIILINLFIGFSISGVDNFAHLGGLIGGFFSAMIVGIEGKTDKSDRMNGIIVTLILIAFLLYIIFR